MYAIVEIAGQQFKVEKDQYLFVHRLEGKEGSKVTFDNVLLIEDKGKVVVGAPAVKGASVSAKVLEHLKGNKVIVFKKKRRKGYQKKNGHRQYFTKILVEGISEKGGVAKKEATAVAPKAAAKEVKTAVKATTIAKPKAVAKKVEATTAAKPKVAAKKPAAKKAATPKAATAKKAVAKKKTDDKK